MNGMKSIHAMKNAFLFILFVFFFMLSCKDNRTNVEINKILDEWIGKEILFPENIPCFEFGKDTRQEMCDELFRNEYKILLYVDSAG